MLDCVSVSMYIFHICSNIRWRITLTIIFVLIVIITFGLVIIANSKFNWMINIFIFILMIIYVVTAFLFRVFPVGLFLLLLLFGVSATYTLKVSEMEKRNGSMQSGKKKQREDASKENKQTEDHM
eukprot:47143_1